MRIRNVSTVTRVFARFDVRWCLGAATLACMVVTAGCRDVTTPESADDLVARYGLEALPEMAHPTDNPPNPDRIDLGRLLFFDPIMSATKDVSCGTCHHPTLAMADGRALPAGPSGVGLGPDRSLTDPDMLLEARNSPTVINAGFNQFFSQRTADGFLFWDGRRRRLENLVTLPQLEFSEMRGDVYPIEVALDSVLQRLREIPEYRTLFASAFPRANPDAAIDSLSLSQALAQFVRSLKGDKSPYDRYVNGDVNALTDQQKRGLVTFHDKAGCAQCHDGPMFSDFDFHVVGARQQGPGFQTTPHEDFGRWNVTHLETDRWKFRTPSLRNVAETAPYTHAGAYRTLREAVLFFANGGGDHSDIPSERVELTARNLTEGEIDALVAFLEALTDVPDVEIPDRLPSGMEPPRARASRE
jgi:cytochrome c peroxidase